MKRCLPLDARPGFDLEADEKPAEAGWRKHTLTGCVYTGSGEVFVKRGDGYRAAAVMLGKKTAPAAAHTCQGDAPQVATAR